LLWDGNGTDKYVPWTTLGTGFRYRSLNFEVFRYRTASAVCKSFPLSKFEWV